MSHSRSVIERALLILALAALASCGHSENANNSAVNAQADRPPVAGFNDLRLGMQYQEALALAGVERFNPVSLAECPRRLPLRGCFLPPRSRETAPYEIREGIPYDLLLSFNRFGRLTDIDLEYQRETGITPEECLSLHSRTLDWLTRDYGPFQAQTVRPGPRAGGAQLRRIHTPGGIPFDVSIFPGGDFVTPPTRQANGAVDRQRPITQWDNRRYVSLLSSFIVVNGTPHCSVGVSIQEPASVPHADLSAD